MSLLKKVFTKDSVNTRTDSIETISFDSSQELKKKKITSFLKRDKGTKKEKGNKRSEDLHYYAASYLALK